MPQPLSATATRTPRTAGSRGLSAARTRTQIASPSLQASRLLASKLESTWRNSPGFPKACCSVFVFTCKVTREAAARGIKVEDFTGDNIGTKMTGHRGLTIKAQRLAGDVGDSLQLAIGFCEMPADLFYIILTAREIDEVDQAFQGVV